MAMSVALSPGLGEQPLFLAKTVMKYSGKLTPLLGKQDASDFVAWVLARLREVAGRRCVRDVRACLRYLEGRLALERGERAARGVAAGELTSWK
jgi:hypothetical protein